MGFFKVSDIPARRVVQYARVSGHGENVVYIEDKSILGSPVDEMPFADKTGSSAQVAGMLFEIPYLADAGDVYFAEQPQGAELKDGSAKLTTLVKGGKPGYDYNWYKNGKEVVNIPYTAGVLTVTQPGKYFARVIDADGVEAVSKEAEVK